MKGFGILFGVATLVVVGVLGLARLIVPDVPGFDEGFVEGDDPNGEAVEFVATAVGARLEITGAREATVTLDSTVQGPTYGIGDSKTRIFFESDPLVLDQMSHDGLAFFPEPGDCEFTEGAHNEDLGLVAVEMSCPELVDIRDNGNISVEGQIALPSDLVIELNLPESGGTVTIGDETITFGEDLHLFVGPSFQGSGAGDIQLTAFSDAPPATLTFPYDLDTGRLRLGRVAFEGGSTEVGAEEECTYELTEEVVVNPQTSIMELDFECSEIQLANVGAVGVSGSLVFPKILATEG